MKTFNLKFNKDNWSGEDVDLKVTEFVGGFEFTVDGDEIRVADRKVYDGDPDPKFEFTYYTVFINDERSDWKVGKLACDDRWDCMLSGDEDFLCRSGAHPAEAVAKVMYNIL